MIFYENEFDIFFRHYLRQWAPKKWMTHKEYGEYIGLSTETIESLAKGRISPNLKVLQDMCRHVRPIETKQRYIYLSMDYENSI